ncbi:MAG: sigma-54 interaction domain-containing protein [Candidatus Hodarchaeota archaeon]
MSEQKRLDLPDSYLKNEAKGRLRSDTQKPCISFVAKDPEVLSIMVQELRQVLGEWLDITPFYLSNLPKQFDTRIVAISTENISKSFSNRLSSDQKVIVCRRTIGSFTIDKLLRVPRGSSCVVMLQSLDEAEETVQILNELGLTHLDYIPCAPDCLYAGTPDLLITFFRPEFANRFPGIAHFDLGPRSIDLSSMMEIAAECGFPQEFAGRLSAKYNKPLVNLIYLLSEARNEATEAKQLLEAVLDQIGEGVLAVDTNGGVIFSNKVACHLLGVGTTDKDIFKHIPQLRQLMSNRISRSGEVLELENGTVVANMAPFGLEASVHGAVIVMREATDVQRQEWELRSKFAMTGFRAKHTFEDIVGRTPEIMKVKQRAYRIAKTEAPVLIWGETGVGKELFAQSIHNASRRASTPFVAVNLSALSDSLAESELFGYEEGAFTGARRGGKPGLFEQAHLGTLFLDEVGNASISLQAKILRAIEEKEIVRVGGTRVIPVNVRIIAATNYQLWDRVKKGLFRADLYFRLVALKLKIPPLRDRLGDMPELISVFCATKKRPDLTNLITERISAKRYKWPGNVRELGNIVEYMCIVDTDEPEEFLFVETPEEDDFVSKRNRYLEDLANFGDPLELLEILKHVVASTQSGLSVGRKSITCQFTKEGKHFTENKVRQRLNALRKAGYLKVKSKRQGFILTPKGVECALTIL